MPYETKYNHDFKKQVIMELQSGVLSGLELTKMYDLANGSISQWKFLMMRTYPNEFKTLRDQHIIKFYNQGKKLEFIQKKLKIQPGTLYNILRENNIEINRKPHITMPIVKSSKRLELKSQIKVDNVSMVNQDYIKLKKEHSELQEKYNDLRSKFGELMLKSQGL